MLRDWLLFATGFLLGQIVLTLYLYAAEYMERLKAEEAAAEEHLEANNEIPGFYIIGEDPPL